MNRRTTNVVLCLVSALGIWALPAMAQQSAGSVSGKVTSPSGEALPGVTVEATSDVLPRPRATMTGAGGEYRLPGLPPGNYSLTFTLEGMPTQSREVLVLLQQDAKIDVILNAETVSETVSVVSTAPMIDVASTELKAAIDSEVIDLLPVGQQYRDLVKLIPGVQYTEEQVRGPSAGGSGQDNDYRFDGVNVALPLFGVLSSEPSSHDIDQVAVVKGGADATEFNRSGGFSINSVSKSGTNVFHGLLSYQIQTEDMTGDRDTSNQTAFEEDKDWVVGSVGGPIVSDRLFFYTSYFRPTRDRDNRSNNYGPVPKFESDRDELFGKLTFTPTGSFLLSASYRDSEREDSGLAPSGVAGNFPATAQGTTSSGSDNALAIAIAEGSWVASDRGFLTFKYTDFENENTGRPDILLDIPVAVDGSVRLDVANLDRQGLLNVPVLRAGETAYNAFVGPIIQRYGFLTNGVPTGGGTAGVDASINDQDFFRESYEVGYEHALGASRRHQLHFGYQWTNDSEILDRASNGWGSITVPGGRITANNQPVFFVATVAQQGIGELQPPIESEFEAQSIEINDTITLQSWTINAGLMISNDELYGEGLRPNSSNVSGFEVAPGNKYLMHEVDFDETLSPRLGATWSQNGRDVVYGNFAKYYPPASSLPRAASWARNLSGTTLEVSFDADGDLIRSVQLGGSSGKFFDDDLDPRGIEEYLVGYSRQVNPRLAAKAHARYRYGTNFWEDTENDSRIRYNPPSDVPRELYIPELAAYRAEIGGSSYVIAELDGAFTKYWEAGLESEWRGEKAFVRGSYVWSHYYGNFDQDNSTTNNDAAIFVGSSFIADGAGRQLWDFKYGDLRGDRRHQLKVYGFYELPWRANAGAFAIFQSGQPWEVWDVEVYRPLTSSTSNVSRFAEPAGSRTSDDHWQIDLNYTQDFPIGERFNIQLRADLYNLFDEQTGYDIQPVRSAADFGQARRLFDPRRLQLAVRFEF
jgi:hypothetical protein